MREAIGSSLLLSIVVVFVSLIILFFVGILSYSKAYKAKNKIIDVIEKYGKYTDNESGKDPGDEIIFSLSEMGYQLGDCQNPNDNLNGTDYKYCIHRVDLDLDSTKGYYYKVTTYVQFYFPVIGDLFSPPVSGETKILGKKYDY